MAEGFVPTLLAQMSVLALGVFTGVASARLLGPQGRGELAALILWPSVLVMLASLGMNQAIVFYTGKQRYPMAHVWAACTLIGLAQSVCVVLVGLRVLPWALHAYAPGVRHLALVFLFATPFLMMGGYPGNLLQGSLDLASFNLIRIIAPLAYALGLAVLLLLRRADLASVVSVQILGYVLALAGGYWLLFRKLGLFCSGGLRPPQSLISKSGAVGLPLGVSTFTPARQEGTGRSACATVTQPLLAVHPAQFGPPTQNLENPGGGLRPPQLKSGDVRSPRPVSPFTAAKQEGTGRSACATVTQPLLAVHPAQFGPPTQDLENPGGGLRPSQLKSGDVRSPRPASPFTPAGPEGTGRSACATVPQPLLAVHGLRPPRRLTTFSAAKQEGTGRSACATVTQPLLAVHPAKRRSETAATAALPRFPINLDVFKSLLTYGGKTQLATITSYINQRLDQLVLSIFIRPPELGLYVVAVTVSTVLSCFPQAAAVVTLANGSNLPREGAKAVIANSFRTSLAWLVAGCSALFLAVPWLIPLVFGARFSGSVLACRILLPGSVAIGLNQVLYDGARSLDEPALPSYGEGLAAVLTCCGLYVLLPRLGFLGAAIASTVAYTASSIFMLALYHFRLGFPLRELLFDSGTPRPGEAPLVPATGILK
jgi:O-antigen/teichoic acid export membrane protein